LVTFESQTIKFPLTSPVTNLVFDRECQLARNKVWIKMIEPFEVVENTNEADFVVKEGQNDQIFERILGLVGANLDFSQVAIVHIVTCRILVAICKRIFLVKSTIIRIEWLKMSLSFQNGYFCEICFVSSSKQKRHCALIHINAIIFFIQIKTTCLNYSPYN
jgi:hypothetical protein